MVSSSGTSRRIHACENLWVDRILVSGSFLVLERSQPFWGKIKFFENVCPNKYRKPGRQGGETWILFDKASSTTTRILPPGLLKNPLSLNFGALFSGVTINLAGGRHGLYKGDNPLLEKVGSLENFVVRVERRRRVGIKFL